MKKRTKKLIKLSVKSVGLITGILFYIALNFVFIYVIVKIIKTL